MITDRIKYIKDSQTSEFFAKALAMKNEGVDIVNLSVGEPDFPTPQNIKDAAINAIINNQTKYTVTQGIPELRQAIANKLKSENQLEYDLDNIVVSNGAKQSIYMAMMAIIEKGDEVIIPSPYWVSYPEIVKLSQGKPVFIDTSENNFKITPHQLKENISNKTKAFILCNPNNPTGAIYTKNELEEIASIVEQTGIYVIADEIYEKLIYDNNSFTSFAAINENVKQKTIVVNGFSKSYSMTGWRLGYAAGPADIIKGLIKLQNHSTSCTSTISQHAALEALAGPQDELSIMRTEFEKRRDFVYNKLQTIPGISVQKPSGAFYVFPAVSSFYGKVFNGVEINDSLRFANYLLLQAHIAVVPGSAFGSENHIRISYSTSMHKLEESMERIADALDK